MHSHDALHLSQFAGLGPPWLLIAGGLLLTGLVGGFLHCAGMCGPFVLGQVGRNLRTVPLDQHHGLRRLSGGLLLPYHFGRLTTYALLGAIAGSMTGGLTQWPGMSWLPGAALSVAAIYFLIEAVKRFGFGIRLPNPWPALTDRLGGAIARLAHGASWGNGYGLGLVLGLLPCGMVYGAVAGAAGSGSALGGGVAMAAFGVGTIPALIVVGTAGAAALRGMRGLLARALPVLYLLNALLLGLLAYKAAV